MLIAVIACALCAACASGRRAASCDAACADRTAVQTRLDQYAHALSLVNSDSVAAYFADDGAIVQPGAAPIIGRRAVRDFLAPFDGKTVVEREVIHTDSMRVMDGVARAWGTFEQTAGARGAAMQTYRGGFVADFVRGADRAWRIERFANVDAAGPGPAYAIDHVILGSADLDAGMREFAVRTGVTPAVGGVHPGRGTRNALASFGNLHYLEILAPDPAQGRSDRNAGLGVYTTLTPDGWAIRTSDIEATARALRAAGFRIEGPLDGARVRPDGVRLAWRTLNVLGPKADLLPFFIEWKTMDAHPSRSAPAGCALGEVAVAEEHEAAVLALVRTVGIHVAVAHAALPAMRLVIGCGAKGTVSFGRSK